ncbi:TetR/AcrR family transcriptional regulator [Planomonospora venezuelensis]|uniref:AcrR family transcriptional regulator n=1 Tax=Planomonospora venezuelensis TaxID=1999 RepID=A0A841CXJ9_PLAVE|nr:TetR family transcriptional regulator [Planomonospora venezuelensis]MBB5961044.1 AcrR family transcriptional regulator [Planomonospora venezuelensis]GIN01328.1 hypothetical protein Pve01_29860 [Planomonospora venezuelensis]
MTPPGPGLSKDRPVPPTAKGGDRREKLLDVTEDILVTRGNAELSLRAVAAGAGVRLGHLQYYFPSRADLINAVLARVLERSLRQVSEITGPEAEGDPVRRHDPVRPVQDPVEEDDRPIRDSVRPVRVLLMQHQDGRLVRLFTEIWAMAAHDEGVATAVRAFYRDYTGHVAEFVHRLAPGLPRQACRARAETFVMLVEGAALFRSGIASEASAETDAELLRTAVALLGGDPPSAP